MVGFALAEFEDILLQAGLYGAVRVDQYGIPQSTQHFYTILERYNPETCTFFTPIGEMGLALHEMYEVSGLMIGDAPYEEYVLLTEELNLLKKSNPLVYKTYWEVLCHFHIYGQVTGWRSGGIKQMSWANYLFPRVNKTNPMTRLAPSTDEEIFEKISASTSSYTIEFNEDTFKPDSIFNSFHHQAKVLISNQALLAGFLILWLKRCVVPTLPPELIVRRDISGCLACIWEVYCSPSNDGGRDPE